VKRVKRESAVDLRRRAEEQLRPRQGRPGIAAAPDGRRLVHELEVHQVELELQNEELRASRLEAEAARDRYAQLFDFAPVGYFVVDAEGAILAVNFAGARLVGAERGALVGRRLRKSVAEADRARFDTFLLSQASGAADGARSACDVFLEKDEEERLEVRITASSLALAEESGAAVLLTVEDVTAWRQAERALREESRHKDEFLATLSHELRNPLGPIRNGLFLLQHVPAGCDQAKKALTVMERQLGHLTHMVEDLLDVTRIARGKVKLVRAPLDLCALARRTLEDHRAGFEARGIALEGWPGEVPCWVEGDATRLAQVLGNLLGNAEKFTATGGRVQVGLRTDGAAAVLSVRDSGVGIEPEVRSHLFEPFAQGAQPLDRTRGGLGLGLATVKGLVELHGGTVSFASDGPGSGAEFTVRLPLVAAPRPSKADGAAHPVSHHRVLVIEDNEDAATSLKQVLELSGHEVELAMDGPSGLLLAHEHRPEVVICDIGLPGMDGYQVARAIRADAAARSAYLIALTGYARPEDARRATEAGFDRHIGKPPPIEKLTSLLADVPQAPSEVPTGW
jgi:PAS domain S-box-containing protein